MVLSEEKIRGYMRRLLLSRMRILCTNGFYGLLIMHMKFTLDEGCETAATDGDRIYFNPQFLEKLSDDELDFVLMHEILHAALQHCSRTGDRDSERFNIACDIVVNSNILKSCDMEESRISLKEYGVSMHIAPNGKEGWEYTVEQVYEMLGKAALSGNVPGSSSNGNAKPASGKKNRKSGGPKDKTWDDHTRWKGEKGDAFLSDVWVKRLEQAYEAVQIRDPSNSRGLVPLCAKRLLDQLRKPQIDWRTVLNSFVQEEIADYSFMPPDRRMEDSIFFLPDFNEKEEFASDILFMIDTSASMSDTMVTAAYSEVKGAIDQFDGKLKGWLGFFDAAVVEPKPFMSEGEFRAIKPVGGGGTDFLVIFRFIREYMQDRLPACIIILTDGYAPFPEESVCMGIPVLWLLNNENAEPAWGSVARIRV